MRVEALWLGNRGLWAREQETQRLHYMNIGHQCFARTRESAGRIVYSVCLGGMDGHYPQTPRPQPESVKVRCLRLGVDRTSEPFPPATPPPPPPRLQNRESFPRQETSSLGSTEIFFCAMQGYRTRPWWTMARLACRWLGIRQSDNIMF